MSLSTVTWRQAVAAAVATFVGLFAVIVVVRSDGLPAVDAASARATSWFVHQQSGRVVLVDGYRGQALGGIDTGAQGSQISVVDGATGAYLLDDSTAEARAIDTVDLRLGTAFGLSALGAGQAVATVGQAGLVVVDPQDGDANVVPVDGEPTSFSVEPGTQTQVARDGAVWTMNGRSLVRTSPRASTSTDVGSESARFALVGNDPVVLDAANRRVRFGTGSWQTLPTDVDPSEILVQASGPSASCGWVGADDDLWCVGRDRIEESASVDGLDMGGADLLGIAGDAAALVRRGPSSIVRFDWRAGRVVDDLRTSVSPDANLQMSVTVDLVWIDDVDGNVVWAVNPWSLEAIDKGAEGILVLGEDGEVVDSGQVGDDIATGPDDRDTAQQELREPDNNGIDDPPVAIDDPVTARTGSPVPVEVTANDYDPDGEAVVVSEVGVPGHGSVDIASASTVVYNPDPGYVGVDEFEYTIVDGAGNEASASVIVELLAAGSTNRPPDGVPDRAETGPGTPVTIDVLLNDIDPERDALRIGSFSPPDLVAGGNIGEVTETVGLSELPALTFTPSVGFEGTAIFTYRPIDSFGAVGDDVEVRVEVARAGDPNRPPVVRPDGIRLRRNVTTRLPVLVNDRDPDGDPLTLSVVAPVPLGLEIEVDGEELSITARAGAAPLVPFQYEVDDLNGHVVRGWVLVAVDDDDVPNRPPTVTADSGKAVVGESVILDVTANDSDPDGDPLTIIAVEQPDDGGGQAVIFSRNQIQFSPAPLVGDDDAQATVRFTYTVTDGNGHEASGEVVITVLPEALGEPPWARDDSTFTYVNVPVTIDVLRNDGDPSGAEPRLAGRPGCPGGGVATVTTDGRVRFDPPRDRSGAFRCTYEVTNTAGLRASASIIVSVRPTQTANRPPVAVRDSLTVVVGATASIDVTANDSDPDGDRSELRVVSSTAPLLGTARREGNVITFTAGAVTGVANINYQVSDADSGVSTGVLTVRVTEAANLPPIAVDDGQTIVAPGLPQQFSVLANDSDPDDTPGGLSVVSATRVSGGGSVSLSGDIVTISPDPDTIGQIVATYTIRDGGGLTASANVVLDVQEPPNRAPEAVDDSAEVANGGTVTTAVLFNDTDLDGDPLSISITSPPDSALGSASLGSNGSIVFTGVPGAAGTAFVGYRVSDGELTDDAVLRIVVLPCAQSTPTAASAFLRTGYRQPITVDLATYASNGNIVDVSGPPGYSGTLYTPPAGENGNVTISYSVVNSCRLRASGQITIDVNQEPVSRPVSLSMLRGTERTVPVSDLATDAEPLTITGTTGAPSWVSTQADRLVLNPNSAAAVGTHTWTATIVDPGGLAVSVPITVTVANQRPVANPDTIDASAGTPVQFDIVANDVDPHGGPLTVRGAPPATITFTNGIQGTVTLLDDGRTVRVDPLGGRGTATFAYVVRSAAGDDSASPATVTVIGPRVNNAPVAGSQTIAVTRGEWRQVVLEVGDPDGDPVTLVTPLDDPGELVRAIDGFTLTIRKWTPGTYVVGYRVTDGELTSPVATITVVVAAPTTTTTTLPPPPTTSVPAADG